MCGDRDTSAVGQPYLDASVVVVNRVRRSLTLAGFDKKKEEHFQSSRHELFSIWASFEFQVSDSSGSPELWLFVDRNTFRTLPFPVLFCLSSLLHSWVSTVQSLGGDRLTGAVATLLLCTSLSGCCLQITDDNYFFGEEEEEEIPDNRVQITRSENSAENLPP